MTSLKENLEDVIFTAMDENTSVRGKVYGKREAAAIAAEAVLDILRIPVWLWAVDIKRIQSYTIGLKPPISSEEGD